MLLLVSVLMRCLMSPSARSLGNVIATGARPGLGTRLMRNPRKSNPSSTWVMCVFSGESVSRIRFAMNSAVSCLSASAWARVPATSTRKSSA